MKLINKAIIMILFVVGLVWNNLKSNWDIYVTILIYALLILWAWSAYKSRNKDLGRVHQ